VLRSPRLQLALLDPRVTRELWLRNRLRVAVLFRTQAKRRGSKLLRRVGEESAHNHTMYVLPGAPRQR